MPHVHDIVFFFFFCLRVYVSMSLKSNVSRGEIVGRDVFVRFCTARCFSLMIFAFGIGFCPILGFKVIVLRFFPMSQVNHNSEVHNRHSINHEKLQTLIVPS